MVCLGVILITVLLCQLCWIKPFTALAQFTKSYYKVNVYQDQGVRRYVTHSEFRMGIQKPPPNVRVVFKIREKSEIMNTFSAESYSLGDFIYLRIRTKDMATLNRERISTYNLTVSAILIDNLNDIDRTSLENNEDTGPQTQVLVRVLDRNDNCPIFSKEQFEFTVAEDVSMTALVGTLTATDADEGLHSEIFYYIQPDQSEFPFSLNPFNGAIHPTEKLHRFSGRRLEVKVAAVHRGDAFIINCEVISQAVLSITIVTNNRHSPVITSHLLSSTSTQFDSQQHEYPYAIITITDADDSEDRVRKLSLVYPLTIANSSIDSVQFSLSPVSSDLNRHILTVRPHRSAVLPDSATVVLVATDLNLSPRTSTISLPINFNRFLDLSLLSLPSVVSITVPENTLVNSTVLLLRPLVNSSTAVKYYLAPDSEGALHGDIAVSLSGIVSIRRELNAEDVYFRKRNVLISVASKRTLKLQIFIEDVNEFPPVVNNNGSVTTVMEDTAVGATVLQIDAYDPDVSRTALSYHMFDEQSVPFTLSTNDRSKIVLKTVLDAETMPRTFRVRVLISDSGSPIPRTVIALYDIEVGDINEYKPEFPYTKCNISISRHLAFDSSLGHFLAEDLDRDGRHNVRVSLASTSLKHPCFSINPQTGSLVLLCSLRNIVFTKVRNFLIRLQANDGPMSSKKLELNVTIVEPEDSVLRSKSIHQECDDNNVYSRMLKNLETLQKHYWKNKSGDKEGTPKTPSVRELPRFVTNIPSVINLREEISLGHVLQKIEMKVDDGSRDPYESIFVFGVSSFSDEQVFIMNTTGPHSAELIVGDRLDRERADKYSLTLTVCDNGQPRYCTTKAILVKVVDINDQYPRFVDHFQTPIEVLENFPVGKKIIQIEATDADEYNPLQYRLINFRDVFRLHKRTGWLKLRASLDREDRDRYRLIVTASDNTTQRQSLTSTLSIDIVVTDLNDNKPLFSKPGYSMSFPEDIPVGSFLVQLYATDADTGINAQLRYTLHGVQSDCFKCNEATGAVHLSCPLSSSSNYRLIALVEDLGQPQSLSSQADFIIMPQKVPRSMYPPTLKEALVHASVKENCFPGTLVATLKIEDADASKGKYIFTISGNSSGISKFQINNDGEIRTIAKIDREMHTSFWLFVFVEDRNEVVIHRTLAEVYVEVLDENDNWPMPDKAFYRTNVIENLEVAKEILTIHATDDDSSPNTTFKFRIVSGDPMGHFSISKTGTLKTTERSIDRESFSGSKSTCIFADSYDLKVSIGDSGYPERVTTVHVHVNVNDINDNAPSFLNNNHFVFTYYIYKNKSESLSKNKKIPIGKVVAIDMDKDLNGTVRYSMTPGFLTNYSNTEEILQAFIVDIETGIFYLNSSFISLNRIINDTSIFQSYNFKLWAFDLGVPTMWSVIPANVKVRIILAGNESGIRSSEGRDGLHMAYELPDTVSLKYDECIGFEFLTMAVVDNLDPSGSGLQLSLEDINTPFAIFLTKKEVTSRYQNEASLVVAQSLVNYKETTTLRFFIRNGQVIMRHNVTIKIKYYNKQPPVFISSNQDLVAINITDPPSLPTVIFKSTAKSPELDVNQLSLPNSSVHSPSINDFIVYYITASNDPDTVQQLFHLHSDNGDLSIVSPISLYRGRTFEMIIAAKGNKSTYIKLRVYISESNKMAPQFLISLEMRALYVSHLKDLLTLPMEGLEEKDKALIQHHISKSFITWFGWVDVSSVIGSMVTSIPAYDQDNGNDGVLTYALRNDSVAFMYFHMDPNSGVIRVARSLSSLINRVVFLNVIIKDNAIRSLYNQSVIAMHIRTSIPMGSLPQMDKTQLELIVYENVPINTLVHCLKLRPTVSSSMPMQYVLLKTTSKNGNLFGVTRTTGCIITSSIIDREVIHGPVTLEIQVRLYTGQVAGYNSIASVKIHIADLNDNAPRFLTPLQLKGVISESANPGSVIFTKSGTGSDSLMKALIIQVEDPDEGENGTIDYLLSSPALSHFQIDSHTGVLSLSAPIDREIFGDYVTLTVQLTDRGKPPLMSHQRMEITVAILDENDCAPKFEKDFYLQNLLLPTYSNAPLLRFRVTDADLKDEIVFSIVDGNKGGFFTLNSETGWLTISSDNVPKSNQLPRVLLMKIRAYDGVHKTECNITIYCVDDSLRQPLPLEMNFIKWDIQENDINVPNLALPRTKLFYFSRYQTPLRYVLLTLHPSVSLDNVLGSLRITAPLDREKEPNFSLLVLVRGWDESHGYINISVTVTDVNDFKPVFLTDAYTFLVDANSSVNMQTLKVKAIDLDAGNNGTLTYSIDYLRPYSDEIKFSINSTSGLISVTKRPVAAMVGRKFSLIVRISDNGRPSLSATSTVLIDIVSNKSPLFTSSNYTSSVWEDMARHSVITTVHAMSSTGHTILYTITSGNNDELFDLDFTTGVVRLAGSLDYELKDHHSLIISATDPSNSLSQYTTVSITVLNRPDEEPVFQNSTYSLSISEKIPITTLITKVSVKLNKKHPKVTKFSLENVKVHSYCDSRNFKIGALSGELSVVKDLDFELCELHQFWIVAIFDGGFLKSTKALMKVTILDTNDNPPIFIKKSFSAVISLQSLTNSLVLIAAATDRDTNTKLHYKIIDASHNLFRIDSNTGFVRFNPGPNSIGLTSQFKSATFKVLVHDTIHSAEANVSVKLISTINNNPSFKPNIVHLKVPENATIGTGVGRLSASDTDFGEFGTLQYRFVGGFGVENFHMNLKTGKIIVQKPLDREKKEIYKLRAVVFDGGGKSDFADVLIHLSDINDHTPIFDQSYYEVTLSAIQKSQTILQLQARDKDQDHRYRMDYRIVYPTLERSPVNVDSITGQMSLKPVWIDSDQFNSSNSKSSEQKLQSHKIIVQVCEQPVLSYRLPILPVLCGAKVPVTINIFKGVLEYVPVVTCSLKSVSENNAVHQLVAVCRVTSSKKGKWSLIPRDPSSGFENNFEIDSEMGFIRARKLMDYEEQSQYRLTVEYREVGTFAIATRSLIIDLIDQNDCGPVFDSSMYSISVSEDIAVGSRIIQCKAIDLDFEGKDKVIYSIHRTPNNNEEIMFRIDESGWIYLVAPLDYEKTTRLEIIVLASDAANHITNTTVTLSVIDINDEPPFWTKVPSREEVQITEDCDDCGGKFPRVVYRLEAQDNDTVPQNKPLRYLISNQNMSPYLSFFAISDDGEVQLLQSIDAEKIIGPLELNILVTDGLHWSMKEFVVVIMIQDVNDNYPMCPQQSQTIMIPEDTKPGTIITTVKAFDLDVSAKFNTLSYRLVECSDPYLLVVESTTGVVIINAPLDREYKSQIKFKVEASDIGFKTCSLAVVIIVTDVNDNDPKFTQYKISPVPENAPFGSVIGKIHAEDADEGLNRKIEYGIIEDVKSSFSIDRLTGIMRVTGALDREKVALHRVVVTAADGGKPIARTSSVTLAIELLDVNDSPPQFINTPLQLNVSEDTAVESLLLTIVALSDDLGQNAVISYRFVTELDQFRLNSSSGQLFLQKSLDYEKYKEFFLSVEASDGGYPSLSTTTVVSVYILDVNDNKPLFPKHPYQFTMLENMPIGRLVGKVTAHDADSDQNSKLTYTILGWSVGQEWNNKSFSTSATNLFRIERDTGEIFIRFVPDREVQVMYKLNVSVTDQGLPPLVSTSIVSVEIEDVNDNHPVFDKPTYRFLIQVDRSGIIPRGELRADGDSFEVGKMKISDRDGPTNSGPFLCKLLNSESGTLFSVKMNENGDYCILLVSGLLHLGSRNLIIQVSDNGIQTLFRKTKVVVDIIRLSNIPPEIEPLNVTHVYFHTFSAMKKEATVARVLVRDRSHAYDMLRFELIFNDTEKSQNRYMRELFRIDSGNGVISTTDQLDSGLYPLLVKVTNGSLATQKMVFIKIVALTQEMIDSSCVVQINSIKPNIFFSRQFDKRLIEFLKKAMASKLAYIISAKSSSQKSNRRKRRQIASNDVTDILIAVYDENENRFFKSGALVARINSLLEDLSRLLEVNYVRAFDNICSDKHVCVHGQCQTNIKVTPNESVNRFEVHGVTFSSPDFVYSSICKCDKYFGGDRCQIPLSKCAYKPCGDIRICSIDLTRPSGYVCECPAFKKGENCDQVIEIENSSSCLDDQCVQLRESEPVNFYGGGFLRWMLGRLGQSHRLDVSFGFRILQKPAPLIQIQWNTLRYLMVDVNERGALIIQLGFHTIPDLDIYESRSLVTDGRWHTLRVSIVGVENIPDWWLHVVLDGLQPKLHSLNAWMEGDLFNQTILLAARDMLMGKKQRGVLSSSAVGCFKDVMVNGIKVPYQQLPPSIQHSPVKVSSKNLNYGCIEKMFSGYCSLGVCKNAGLCKQHDESNRSYSCQCQGPFSGKNCVTARNPCRFSPCLNFGKCQELSNGYKCSCPDGISGPQCQWGRGCSTVLNPCPHSSSCIEHLVSEQSSTSVCRCPPSFQGYLCQTDVDECGIRPPLCQLGKGICHNTHGGYQCNCSLGYSGHHCESDSIVAIYPDTSSLGLSQFHIYMIIGILACLFVLALLTVVVLVLRLKPASSAVSRRKKDRNAVISLDPLYQIKAYSGDQCSRYSPASSMMASSMHHPGYVGGFMVEPPPGTPGSRSQMSYHHGQGTHYRRLSQDAIDRVSLCSSNHGAKEHSTPIPVPVHYQKSGRGQMYLNPSEPRQGLSPHSSTFSLVPCNVGPQQHLHLVPNRNSMMVYHGPGYLRGVYDPMLIGNSNLSLHSSKGLSGHWELNEEMVERTPTDVTSDGCSNAPMESGAPTRQTSADTQGPLVNGDIENSIMSWSGQYNDDPIANKEMISSQEMSFTETTDRSTALLLPKRNKGMMLHNCLPPVSSHGESLVSANQGVQSSAINGNGNKESPSTASPSSTSIPSGTNSSDTKGTAPVCEELVQQKKGIKVSSDSNSAEGTECDTDDIEMDQQLLCPSTFQPNRHLQEEDVEDGLVAMPLLDSII